jgi:hypothetical protein
LRWKFDHWLDDLAQIEPTAQLAAVPHLPGAVMSWLRISVVLSLACTVTQAVRAAEKIDLTAADEAGQLTHVSIQLDASGNNLVRPQQPASPPQNDKATTSEQTLPISVAAKLAFDEKRLVAPTADTPAGTPLAVRSYDEAEAAIKVNETTRTPRLSDDKQVIVVEQGEQRPMMYCPNGPLTREQLDLVDVVGDPFVLNRLLPNKAVAAGESWANDASVMGPLLTLDTVAVCEVQSILDESNANFAKVRFAGDVHGSADGAATQLEVRGVYLFDRKLRRIIRLNLAAHEKRSIGGATPGLDAVAKVQVKIEPIEKSTRLSEEVIAKLTTAERMPLHDLEFESAKLGFRTKHDRQWYTTAEGREAFTFRRVDGDVVVAQCTLTILPSKSAGRQTTLERFQKDVTFSLGKSFGELVSSRQWQNAAGLYCYEVVARGLVEDLPVEWHYYLAAPESGPRISFAVTIEKPMLERVRGADRDLVETLQLFPAMPPAQTAEQPSGTSVK